MQFAQTFLGNPQRTGVSKYCMGSNAPQIIKRINLPHWPPRTPESTCVFDEDGNIYFGCHDGCFYSVSPAMKVRWSFRTACKIYSSPTLWKDKVYFAGGDGNLYCFKTDGTLHWRSQFSNGNRLSYPGRLIKGLWDQCIPYVNKVFNSDYLRDVGIIHSWASPNIDTQGRLFISGSGAGLWIFKADTGALEKVIQLPPPSDHLAGAAIDSDDCAYVPSQQRYLYSIRNLQTQWTYDSGCSYDAWACPSVDDANGLIFCCWARGSRDGFVAAISKSGKEVWRYQLGDAVRTTPVHLQEDKLIVVTLSGTLHCINRLSGKQEWTQKLCNVVRAFWSTPCIDAYGNILISLKSTFTTGRIFALNPQGQTLWNYETGKVLSTPVLDAEGRIYFGNSNGEFCVIAT